MRQTLQQNSKFCYGKFFNKTSDRVFDFDCVLPNQKRYNLSFSLYSGVACYNILTVGEILHRRNTNVEDMHWGEIHRLFLCLTTEEQLQFITYLRALQDSEDNSRPQPCALEKESQTNA